MARKYKTRDATFSTIKPAHKTTQFEPIDATFIDLFVINVYVPTYFAYRLAGDSLEEYTKFVTRLKKSLEKVLVPFSLFAGRWITNDKNVHQLIDNGKGVPFKETYIEEDIDAVVEASAGGCGDVPELNLISYEAAGLDFWKMQQETRPEGFPPLVVQVTRFKKGGVVLGVSFDHAHCDAKAFFLFMSAWSEVARTGKSTIQPDFNRSVAITYEPSVKTLFGEAIPRDGFLGRLYSLRSAMVGGDSPFVSRTYEVKASAIEALKKEAKESHSGQFVSTNDCVTAQLTKVLALLPVSVTKGRQTMVGYVVEGRNKFFDPTIPNLIGNVVTTAGAPMPSNSEVAQKPVYFLAQLVRESVLQIDAKKLFSVESLQAALNAFTDETDLLTWVNTSWSDNPVYDIDFGVGGKPYYAVPYNTLSGRKALGNSFVLPPIPGHSFSAATFYIYSSPEVLKALESLDEFWSFFVEIPGRGQSQH